jgi:hypothetical protein
LTSPNRIRLINIAHYRRIIIAKYVSPELSEFINPPVGLTSRGRDRVIAIAEIRGAAARRAEPWLINSQEITPFRDVARGPLLHLHPLDSKERKRR